MKQRDAAWFEARRGRVTASNVSKTMMPPTSQTYINYRSQIVLERLGVVTEDDYISPAMQWGIEVEPQARAAYALETGNTVTEQAFAHHPTLHAGASPDMLIGKNGLVEIKCPNSSTHLETLNTGHIKKEYLAQITFQLLCTQRKFCDFVSFDPRLPAEMRLSIQRVELDEKLADKMSEAVTKFISEVDRLEDGLRKKYNFFEEKAA